jgi:hypothetical protein
MISTDKNISNLYFQFLKCDLMRNCTIEIRRVKKALMKKRDRDLSSFERKREKKNNYNTDN